MREGTREAALGERCGREVLARGIGERYGREVLARAMGERCGREVWVAEARAEVVARTESVGEMRCG